MAKNISVLGIYPDRTTLSDAIAALHQARYRQSDIAVLLADNSGSREFAHTKRSKAPEGAAAGAIMGAMVGALVGWLIASGWLAAPGLEVLAASTPAIAALAGAGAIGVLGWLGGLFAGAGKSEYVAKRYAGRTRDAGLLLSVHCDDSSWCHEASRTLKETGAQHISIVPESTADFTPLERPAHKIPVRVKDHHEEGRAS